MVIITSGGGGGGSADEAASSAAFAEAIVAGCYWPIETHTHMRNVCQLKTIKLIVVMMNAQTYITPCLG